MIPILKEIVEILFADGLIKILFATTTFAIGLNMPARAVMFYKLKKFNGQSEEFLLPSEYLQMAGRAGRRGKDDKGYSLIYLQKSMMFMQQDVPSALQDMMDVKSGVLESKYKLTYKIMLYVLSKDDGMLQLERVMRSSFLENQGFQDKVKQIKKVNNLQKELELYNDIDCSVCTNESVEHFNENFAELLKLNYSITKWYNMRQIWFPQVIEFTFDGWHYHIGSILNDKSKGQLIVLTHETIVRSSLETEEIKSESATSIDKVINYNNITKVFDHRLKTKIDFNATMIKYSSKQQVVQELQSLDTSSKYNDNSLHYLRA